MIDWSGWTPWQNLLKLDPAHVPSSCGAYAVSTGRNINRAVGRDREGILHIGESSYLRDRIKNFRNCASCPTFETHMAGWRYKFFRFDEVFPLKELRVRWRTATTKNAAYEAEARVLTDYLKAPCELPPLNYKFNWALWKQLHKEMKSPSRR